MSFCFQRALIPFGAVNRGLGPCLAKVGVQKECSMRHVVGRIRESEVKWIGEVSSMVSD